MTGNIKPMSELLKENAALRAEVKKLTAPLSEKEQMRKQLAVGLNQIIDAQLAVHKRHEQNEADKSRQVEILNERTPFILLDKAHPDREKLVGLDAELSEVRKRMNFFAGEIRTLGEVEKTARRNFAGC